MSFPIPGYPQKSTIANEDLVVIEDVAAGNTKHTSREDFISSAPLPADTVDEQAIENGAVTTNKLGDGAATDDKWRNGVAFRARREGSHQNISSSTFTKVQYNGTTYDLNGDFDTTNHRFVAPVKGIYTFIGGAYFQNANTRAFVSIFVNGSDEGQDGAMTGHDVSSSDRTRGSIVATELELEAGDYVEVFAWSSTSDSLRRADSTTITATVFSGHLVTRT